MGATPAIIDFSDVPEEGGRTFNKKRQPAGDYLGKIVKVQDEKSKKDGIAQWLYTIQVGRYTYPYYCKLQANQYWKIRGLFKAAGIPVPSKRVKVNPELPVGKNVGVTLEDDEYDGKEQSVVDAIFPPSELQNSDVPDQGDDEEEIEDDEVEETPAPKAKKKPPTAPVVDDDELDELEVEDL